MKKILALLMSFIMLFSCAVFSSAKDVPGVLRFDENGKFKILLLADIQSGYPVGDALKAFIEESIDATNPELVIFLGDNIMGAEDNTEESYWKGYDEVFPILERKNVPFTLVFGNHDDESISTVTKEQMLLKCQSYDGCLAYDAVPSLHGTATHNLPIFSSNGVKIAYNLWMMDSGDYCYDENGKRRGYDCVRKDQIDWYLDVSNGLEKLTGAPVPSMMFQHIVTQEVAQKVMYSLPFQLGSLTKNFSDGTSFTYIPNVKGFSGIVGEAPCPSVDNEGQWSTISERGDVKAVFFGHDHVNAYSCTVDGVDGINVPGATFKSYSSYTDHGAMLVTLDENNLDTYETEMIYVNDLAVKEGSKIPNLDSTKSVFGYKVSIIVRKILHATVDFIRRVFNIIPV